MESKSGSASTGVKIQSNRGKLLGSLGFDVFDDLDFIEEPVKRAPEWTTLENVGFPDKIDNSAIKDGEETAGAGERSGVKMEWLGNKQPTELVIVDETESAAERFEPSDATETAVAESIEQITIDSVAVVPDFAAAVTIPAETLVPDAAEVATELVGVGVTTAVVDEIVESATTEKGESVITVTDEPFLIYAAEMDVTESVEPVVAGATEPVMVETLHPFSAEIGATTTTAPVLEETAPPVLDESTPPVLDENTPPVLDESTPPVLDENTPPVLDESTPPVLVESTPPVLDENTPPVLDENTPPVLGVEYVETTLDLFCPCCSKGLAIRREHFGITGACVYCKTQIVANQFADGRVAIVRVSDWLTEPTPTSVDDVNLSEAINEPNVIECPAQAESEIDIQIVETPPTSEWVLNCPSCDTELTTHRDMLGIPGVCVGCHAPIIAHQFGNGTVGIVRVSGSNDFCALDTKSIESDPAQELKDKDELVETIDLSFDEGQTLDLMCPCCKIELSIDISMIGINGACVECNSPIVAHRFSNGQVAIVKVESILEDSEFDTPKPEDSGVIETEMEIQDSHSFDEDNDLFFPKDEILNPFENPFFDEVKAPWATPEATPIDLFASASHHDDDRTKMWELEDEKDFGFLLSDQPPLFSDEGTFDVKSSNDLTPLFPANPISPEADFLPSFGGLNHQTSNIFADLPICQTPNFEPPKEEDTSDFQVEENMPTSEPITSTFDEISSLWATTEIENSNPESSSWNNLVKDDEPIFLAPLKPAKTNKFDFSASSNQGFSNFSSKRKPLSNKIIIPLLIVAGTISGVGLAAYFIPVDDYVTKAKAIIAEKAENEIKNNGE